MCTCTPTPPSPHPLPVVPIKLPSVNFSVGSLVPFRIKTFSTSGVVHKIAFKLQDGDHTFTSDEFFLGIVHASGGRRLIGHLSFSYSYSAKNRTITLCGTDFPSADGMTLVTKLDGSRTEICIEHASAGTGFAADEGLTNRTWNYRSRLMPGAAQVIKDTVRNANDSLIAALVASPDITVVQVRETVPESLSASDYHQLSAVHRNGRFLELYNPTRKYDVHDEISPVDSTFGGTCHWNAGTNFANVIGSDDDPYPRGFNSWISLWRAKVGNPNPNTCTSQGWASGNTGFPCTQPPPLGGHVILGTRASTVNNGANHTAAIFPICVKHNNNDGVYMKVINYTTGVWLDNYMNRG